LRSAGVNLLAAGSALILRGDNADRSLQVKEIVRRAEDDESTEVLDAIGVSPASLFVRREDAAHIPELAATVIGGLHAQPETPLCLTRKGAEHRCSPPHFRSLILTKVPLDIEVRLA
jgi:hypothetical protein